MKRYFSSLLYSIVVGVFFIGFGLVLPFITLLGNLEMLEASKKTNQ